MSVLFLSLLQIITTSSQTSGICNSFFIDVFQSIDAPFAGNSPINTDSPEKYTPNGNYPYVAYPIDTCTLMGNDFDPQASSYANYAKVKCSADGTYVSRCQYIDDSCAGNCDDSTDGSADFGITTSELIFGEGECECVNGGTVCHQDKGKYYMEIGYWKAYTNDNTGCPGVQLDLQTYIGFEYGGFTRLATGICVKQDNNEYIMATCDKLTGELGVYTDANCNNKDRTLLSYSTTCQYYDNPQGLSNTFRYFTRLEGCYVNDNDIQEPTPSPTHNPTKFPTKYPSKFPTISPTKYPTKTPTTPVPSRNPTNAPSNAPTIPSKVPSNAPTTPKPTKNPNTPKPTTPEPTYRRTPSRSPTAPSSAPTQTDRVQQAANIAKGLTLMEIGIIIGSILFLCICCVVCCWYKKKQLKEIREKHATKRSNRRKQLQLMQRRQAQQRHVQTQQRQVVRQTSPGIDGDRQPIMNTTTTV